MACSSGGSRDRLYPVCSRRVQETEGRQLKPKVVVHLDDTFLEQLGRRARKQEQSEYQATLAMAVTPEDLILRLVQPDNRKG